MVNAELLLLFFFHLGRNFHRFAHLAVFTRLSRDRGRRAPQPQELVRVRGPPVRHLSRGKLQRLVLARALRPRGREAPPAIAASAHEADAVRAVGVGDENDHVDEAPHERGQDDDFARVAATPDAERHAD